MKVIKHGKFHNPKPVRVKCEQETCGCVFEANRKEFRMHDDSRDGDFVSINCPECGKMNTIDAELFASKDNFTK